MVVGAFVGKMESLTAQMASTAMMMSRGIRLNGAVFRWRGASSVQVLIVSARNVDSNLRTALTLNGPLRSEQRDL